MKGVSVNMTLCFSANQAILAAKAGAMFVSPFVGRLDDLGGDGMELIEEIVQIYNNYNEFNTQIIVASVRSSLHVQQAALIGADICTVPEKILNQLVHHPLTDKGLDQFLSDWTKTEQKI
jgi:transaldolase